MTLSEFKAWFEGFSESMDGPPGAKAWERIQARVKEISGTPVTERVYIDRYVDRYRDLTRWPYVSYSAGAVSAQNSLGNAVLTGQVDVASLNTKELAQCTHSLSSYQAGTQTAVPFDSHKAMAALGRTEAQSLAA